MANTCNEQALKEKISAVDFAITETVLYLDAYPTSEKALAFYRRLVAQKAGLVTEYERRYGPLTHFGNTDCSTWRWVDGPWPWECEAN